MLNRRAARRGRPGYPDAGEVLARRREFLALFGKLAVGAALVTSCGPPIRLGGKVMPVGEPPPADPEVPPNVGCEGEDCLPLPGEAPVPDPRIPGGIRPPDPVPDQPVPEDLVPLGGEMPQPEPPDQPGS